MAKSIILIPSRLEATRLPNKPLLKINNKSIIMHVYEKAIECGIGDVFVTTCDEEIINEVQKNGGKSIFTSKHHNTGTDRIAEALDKIKSENEVDYIINLQGDEPFINPGDIRKLNSIIKKNKSDIGTIATKIKKSNFSDKSIVKVTTEDQISKKELSKAKKFIRKCKTSKIKNIYSHVGIYQYQESILKKFVNLRQSKNEIMSYSPV